MIRSLAWNGDGMLATVGDDKEVKLWAVSENSFRLIDSRYDYNQA